MYRMGLAGTALVFVVAVSGLIGVAQVRTTQTTDATAEGAARETLEAFITEWNTAEDANVRQVLNFPFVSVLGVDAPVIDPSPEDFSQGFDQLRDREGWSHSSFDFDSFTVVKSSPDKVHAEIDFSRYRADGTAYLNSRVFYILTKRDDHWGIQLRTRAGFRSDLEERERAEIVTAARQAVLDFFTAFNAGDADRTVETLNHPHIFMTAGGGFGVAEDVVDGPRPDFDGMRQREDWHHEHHRRARGEYRDPEQGPFRADLYALAPERHTVSDCSGAVDCDPRGGSLGHSGAVAHARDLRRHALTTFRHCVLLGTGLVCRLGPNT